MQMMANNNLSDKVPKIIHIRIYKGEGFQLSPHSFKKKKTSTIWRVVCSAGSKKQATQPVAGADGNPFFNCDMKIKISEKHIFQPVVLLVIDSHENQVGQVLLMPTKVPPPPQNANLLSPEEAERVTFNPENLWREELEQTKKNSDPQGYLSFWCFVEEYRPLPVTSSGMASSKLRSSRNSLAQSRTSLFSLSKQDLKDIFRGKSSSRRGSQQSEDFQPPPPQQTVQDEEAVLSRQLYGNGSYARSSGNLSLAQQVGQQYSRSPSECSVILHQDERDAMDNRGDSDGSSLALSTGLGGGSSNTAVFTLGGGGSYLHGSASGMTVPALCAIPPSPTTSGSTVDIPPFRTPNSVSVHRSKTLGSPNDLRQQFPASAAPSMVPGEFHVSPEWGALNEEVLVRLHGFQLAAWIRSSVMSVRIHTHCVPLDEAVSFLPAEDPESRDTVLCRMPPQREEVECRVELESTNRGMVASLNIFHYSLHTRSPQPSPVNSHHQQDARRSASFNRDFGPPMKPPLMPQTQQQRSAKRSLGGSLLNLAGLGGGGGSSSNNSSGKASGTSKQHQRNQSESFNNVKLTPAMSPVMRTENGFSNGLTTSETVAPSQTYELCEMNSLLSKENTDLSSRVGLAEQRLNQLMDENVTLKSRLASRDKEIMELSESLCKLRLRLLNDGLTQYLEVP